VRSAHPTDTLTPLPQMQTSLITRVAGATLLGGTALAGGTPSLTFTHLGTVDLSSTANPANAEYIGSNPAAVALSNGTLFVAGYNNSGSVVNTGIVTVSGALSGSPTIGAAFGVRSTPGLRGFSGLDISGSTLCAAFDPGSSVADGIAAYDAGTGALLWQTTARGGSGVGVDPGPGGNFDPAGSGAGWTTFGSGRRALNDLASGAAIYTTGDGMIINGAGTGTFWRDMDYDDATGNIWLREGNNVISATRTGNNSITGTTLVVDETEADFVPGQNIAYLQGLGAVIYNERSTTAGGQDFYNSVRLIDEAGNSLIADFGSYAPAASSAYYDFSYDAASTTLAILDFANRTVDLFDVAPFENSGVSYCEGQSCPCLNQGGAGEGCANSTGAGALLVGSGDADVANDSLTLTVSGAPAGNFGIFYQGDAAAANPMGDGVMCANVTKRYQVQVIDAAGGASRTGFGAFAASGATRYYQFWFRDVTGSPCGGNYNFSNGWTVTWN
jgi:hypothetical protein